MKKIAKDVLFGILIIISITALELIVTLPFGEPWELSPAGYSYFINRELLLTSLPAALVTFMFTRLLRTESKSDALRRGVVWTIIVFLNYFIIGSGNNNLGEIFRTFGIYTLLVGVFVGPVFYAKLKHLE